MQEVLLSWHLSPLVVRTTYTCELHVHGINCSPRNSTETCRINSCVIEKNIYIYIHASSHRSTRDYGCVQSS